MKQKLLTILVFLTLGFAFTLKVNALSPTPTETDSAGQEIRDKVKEIVQEKIQQTQKGEKRAFFGEINAIADEILTLNTSQGEKKIRIATDSALIGTGNKKIKLQDLKTGLFTIAMGFMEDNNVLGVRRLVVGEKSKTPEREVAFGMVTDISSQENILTIKNEKKNLIYTVEVNSKTVITKKVDGKVQKVKLEVITKGDKLVAIGTPSENEEKIITAKIIHVIPGLTEKEGKSIPTPSPKATPTTEE
ncbi:hypothetical protein FJZ41_01625 [Candidatus Shapirobacteria bacterium]|nr:hypothetical protein [Candidatus Shapirobacteria bacterium]